MAKNQSRRNFLRAAPLAAVTLPLADALFLASNALSEDANPASPEPFQLFTADKLASSLKSFEADPGEHYLFQPKAIPMTIAMFIEGKKVGKEFEYHETRDHIFLILDGAVKFDLGGTPKNPRNTKPGEWLAPDSEGATTVEAKKGDMLIVPRGTPHRQSSDNGVKWILISTSGSAKV